MKYKIKLIDSYVNFNNKRFFEFFGFEFEKWYENYNDLFVVKSEITKEFSNLEEFQTFLSDLGYPVLINGDMINILNEED